MSRNTIKITKALKVKGYEVIEIVWTPVGSACEMCGPDGGWYIDYGLLRDDSGESEYVDTILAYSIGELLEEIENLPEVAELLEEEENI